MKKGFTLSEVIIVVAILALLFAYLVPTLAPIAHRVQLDHKVKLISQMLYDEKARSISGQSSHNTSSITDNTFYAHNIYFGENGIRTYELPLASTDIFNRDKVYKINTTNVKTTFNNATDYNYLSGDGFFSTSNSLVPTMAKVKDITLHFQNGGSMNAKHLNLIFMPLSNEVEIYSNNTDGKTKQNNVDTIDISLESTSYSYVEVNFSFDPYSLYLTRS